MRRTQASDAVKSFGLGTERTAVTYPRTVPTLRALECTAAQLARAGSGIALVPTSAVPPRFDGIVEPLQPNLRRTVVAMIGSPSDALVQRFVADSLRRGITAGRPG